jgi:replicative DNA helicase
MFSYEFERQLLAGLLRNPSIYSEISGVISKSDFVAKINETIFSFLSNSYERSESVDANILAEKIALSGIGTQDNIDIGEYLSSISLRNVSEESAISAAAEVKKLSIRREISQVGEKLSSSMEKLSPEKGYNEIVEIADQIFNSTISSYENTQDSPQNIFEDMADFIEERGRNPVTDFGPKGPHPRLHQLLGSLLRPGNITTIVARSGVGKTQFVMDFCTKVSLETGIPVLHLDNGEMSKEELIMRECSALSGVPIRLLETGQWTRAGQEVVDKVRRVFMKLKGYKFYYVNVGGQNVDTMIQKIKHFYFSKVGRGKPMILSFDYIKTTSESMQGKSEWQIVGEMVDKFKKLIMRDLVFDDKPSVTMITSVQSNRTGITNNRRSDNLVEDESIVSLSDRITQFSSHLLSLRQKTIDEITEEEGFGTHKLTWFKHRHLGEMPMRAKNYVRMPNGDQKKNCINLNIENFCVTEVGDMQDLADAQMSADLNVSNQADLTDIGL